jgi:LemA protein
MGITAVVTITIIVLVVFIAILYFNKFVRLKNKVKEAWSSVDVQLKRRYNVIPNLIETVKGYTSHEKEVMESLTLARTRAIEAGNVADQAAAENSISSALKSIFAVAENYPDLKANTNFLQLQEALLAVEDEIQMARRYYNAVVNDNNTALEQFPGVLFAMMFGFKTSEFFEIMAVERENVKVKFD